MPDVSLHASAAQHGYPVYCTTGACGHAGWMTLGGTSASAPLLAGIVADMNSYSLAHGGARLGFADPFLYDSFAADPAAFRDVTTGTNNPDDAGPYPATPGYDQASGIGAPLAGALAADLAAYAPAQPAFAATRISALPSGPGRFGTGASSPCTACSAMTRAASPGLAYSSRALRRSAFASGGAPPTPTAAGR